MGEEKVPIQQNEEWRPSDEEIVQQQRNIIEESVETSPLIGHKMNLEYLQKEYIKADAQFSKKLSVKIKKSKNHSRLKLT